MGDRTIVVRFGIVGAARHCFLWTPSLLWTMVVSNLLIGLAYYTIPVALLVLVRKRQDLIHRHVFVLFAAFIFGCGTTHLVKLWTIWQPVYWLQGAADAATVPRPASRS